MKKMILILLPLLLLLISCKEEAVSSINIKPVKTISPDVDKYDNFGAFLDINDNYIICSTNLKNTYIEDCKNTVYLYDLSGNLITKFGSHDPGVVLVGPHKLGDNFIISRGASIADKKINFYLYDMEGKLLKKLYDNDFGSVNYPASIVVTELEIFISSDTGKSDKGIDCFDFAGNYLYNILLPDSFAPSQYGLTFDYKDNKLLISSYNKSSAFLYNTELYTTKRISVNEKGSFGHPVSFTDNYLVCGAGGSVYSLIPKRAHMYILNQDGTVYKKVKNRLFDSWGIILGYNSTHNLIIVGTGRSRDADFNICIYSEEGNLLKTIKSPYKGGSKTDSSYFGKVFAARNNYIVAGAPGENTIYLYEIVK